MKSWRCNNADLKIPLYVCVHVKTTPWKFRIFNPKDYRVICPQIFLNFLKSRLILNIIYCFWMFVNKLCAHISKSKRYFNVKSSTYYFHTKTNILADFQIHISVPLIVSISVKQTLLNKYIFKHLSMATGNSFWPEPNRVTSFYGSKTQNIPKKV